MLGRRESERYAKRGQVSSNFTFADPTISEPGKADLSGGGIPIQHLPNYPVSVPDTTQISRSPVQVTKCPK